MPAEGSSSGSFEIGFTRGTITRVKVAESDGYRDETVSSLGPTTAAGVYSVAEPTPSSDGTSTAQHTVVGYDAAGKAVATLD